MTTGYIFSSQLERVAGLASGVAISLTVWIALALTVILARKHIQRRALHRRNPEL